jgi:[protein-PII] uridylyltransferase
MRPPHRPGAAHIAPPRVLIDQHATPRATVLEVRAPDGIGLLSRIAGAIARCGCDIQVVRADTLGHEVVDTFYVTDQSSGLKIGEADRLARLERSILESIVGAS